ncbi:MAG: hypothetical protein DHS20C05_20300 [Hyphococcus sp.]|nr:MAG: hypothetical protein DHS20C05_20300 [Marinicaulis sp.]
MKIVGTSIAVAAAATLLASCGGGKDDAASREAQIEKEAAKHGIDADVTVDDKGDVETVELKHGNTVVGNNVSLPDGFPEDIVIPSDWNVMASAPVPGVSGFSIQALSNDDADTILATVRKSMTANGWSEISDGAPAAAMARAGFEKDGRMATFAIIPNGETNAVQLMTMKKPG